MPDGAGGFADSIMGMVGGGAPSATPPPGGAPGPGGAGGPPGGAPPPGPPGAGGGPPADPMQRLQAGLTLVTLTLSELGLTETAHKAVNIIVKAVERLMKQTPQGRQGAVMQGAVPPQAPPGVGNPPGVNVA